MFTESLRPLATLLYSVLNESDRRRDLISEFQQRVWNAPAEDAALPVWDYIRDLAYDLDFYEPDPKARAEDPSYYGDERLVSEISSVLKKLQDAN